MLKQLTLSGLVLATTTHIALADTMYHKTRHANYKGEGYYKPMAAEPVAAAPCPTPFNAGPYLGFSVGARTNYTSDPTVYKGLEGTLFGGYGALLTDAFYLAGEIFAGDSAKLQNYTNDRDSDGDTDGSKSSWTFGASIIPGYLITDNVLGYFRAGVARTHFTDVPDNSTGAQLGLGLQVALDRNWDLRGEYDYSFYNSVTDGELGNPKSDQFNVGLVYKFL